MVKAPSLGPAAGPQGTRKTQTGPEIAINPRNLQAEFSPPTPGIRTDGNSYGKNAAVYHPQVPRISITIPLTALSSRSTVCIVRQFPTGLPISTGPLTSLSLKFVLIVPFFPSPRLCVCTRFSPSLSLSLFLFLSFSLFLSLFLSPYLSMHLALRASLSRPLSLLVPFPFFFHSCVSRETLHGKYLDTPKG